MLKMFLAGVTVMFLPALALGLSYSIAQGYAPAAHLQDNDHLAEWFGPSGSVYDGVEHPSVLDVDIKQYTIDVWLNNPSAAGSYEWLSVWVDWNQDMAFDTSELIFSLDKYWFDNGRTILVEDILVPADCNTPGLTWMRARITADGPLMPGGDYYTGEVEDHEVFVEPIPEPVSLALLGMGLLGLGTIFRKRIG